MFDVMESLIESDEFQREFCRNCPAIEKISGARGSFGVPMEPDDYVCPADFVPGDGGCVRCDVFERVVALLEEVEAWLRGA
jgi:hypothetical protein